MKHDTMERVRKAQALIDGGYAETMAAKEAGMNASTFKKYRHLLDDEETEVVVHKPRQTREVREEQSSENEVSDFVVITTSANLRNVLSALQ